MKGIRILVTGARGFVGSYIVKRARSLGVDVIAAHRGLEDVRSVHLDVCSSEEIALAVQKTSPSLIIHCAAYGLNYAQQDFRQALAVNVEGSLRLLEAAKLYGVRRFVHLGTCFEYGSYDVPIKEDFALNPTGIYGATKAAASVLMKQRAAALGIELIVVRPFSIWGAGDASYHLVPKVIEACLRRSPLELSPCEVLRDYMHVEDVADRIVQLSIMRNCQASSMIVNVGSGRGCRLKDFVMTIARELGGEDLMRFGAIPYRPNEMKAVVADATVLGALLPDRPEVPIQRGVRDATSQMLRCMSRD